MINLLSATAWISKRSVAICQAFILSATLTSAAFAADDFVVYRAKYRPAEELVAQAKGLFGGSARLSSMNEKIVISAPKKTSEAVLALFAELDRKPRRFSVSYRNVSSGESSATGVGIDNRGVRLRDGSAASRGLGQGTVQALEGSSALVGGVKLKLQALGDSRVRVQVLDPGIATETDISLGRWHPLGGVSHQSQGTRSEILSRDKGAQDSRAKMEIRVVRSPD